MLALLVRSLIGLGVLAGLFWVLQRRWPAMRQPPLRTRALVTDLAYWIVTPQVTRSVTKIVVLLVAAVWAVMVTGGAEPGELVTAFSSRSPIGAQPIWLQAVEVMLLAEFLGYWLHRAFHMGGWWRFHAIHHSPTRLSWLSALRLHPVNDLLGGLLRVMPLFLLGFRLDVLAGYLPGTAIYGLLLHANVRWDFGWLRHVIATPAFHRWHHAADAEGRDKNFAGLLPVFDLIFGTFYMPGRAPQRCGVDDPVPEGVLGQMLYPWREGKPGRHVGSNAARRWTSACLARYETVCTETPSSCAASASDRPST